MRAHSADAVGSIPTCAAVLMAALLAGCGDPYDDLPMRPSGYWGNTQLLTEQATGCLYVVNNESRTVEQPAPLLRPDGSHMGCRAATASAVGTKAEGRSAQNTETGRMEP